VVVALAVVAALLLRPSDPPPPMPDGAAGVAVTGVVIRAWDGSPVVLDDAGTPHLSDGSGGDGLEQAAGGRVRVTGDIGRPRDGAEDVPALDVETVTAADGRGPALRPADLPEQVDGTVEIPAEAGAELRVDGLAAGTADGDGRIRWDSRTVRDGWHLAAVVPADGASLAHAWVRVANGAGPPGVLPGRTVFADDFESGDLSRWDLVQSVGRRGLRVVEGPARDGTHSARVEVRQGDDPIDSSGNRNELSHQTGEEEGQERWYAFSVLPAPDFPRADTWQVLAQWHADAQGPPPVGLYAQEDRLLIQVNRHEAEGVPLSTEFPWSGPLRRGRWHDVVMRVRWSGSDERGQIQLWMNGVEVLPTVAIRTLYPGEGAYMKMGYYRNETIAPTGVVYHDAVRVTQTTP